MALTAKMEEMGYHRKRRNFGYDLDRRTGARMLVLDAKAHPPKMSWVSKPESHTKRTINRRIGQVPKISRELMRFLKRRKSWMPRR